MVIILRPRESYLIGRFYRDRSAHLKLTNLDQAHQILSDRMDSQSLVSLREISEKCQDQLRLVNRGTRNRSCLV